MNSLVESIGKSEFRIMYNNTLCEFIPSPNCSLDEIPDTVKGKVVYVNIGEYNPLGWFHDVIVSHQILINFFLLIYYSTTSVMCGTTLSRKRSRNWPRRSSCIVKPSLSLMKMVKSLELRFRTSTISSFVDF